MAKKKTNLDKLHEEMADLGEPDYGYNFPMMEPPKRKKGKGAFYGDVYYCSEGDEPYNPHLFDKNTPMNTFLHYTAEDLRERTVFGARKEGLFYNYNDRLTSEEWSKGLELAAKTKGVEIKSARFYEIALNHFHKTDNVNLQHVILGCNRSNGYSYLVFGYTYTSKKE